MDKYKNKYRISSARLLHWNYADNGAYFITICTKKRVLFLGTILNEEMILNETGSIVQKYWLEIPVHFLFASLGNFVVMPNHFHGILIIDNPHVETLHCKVSTAHTDTITPKQRNGQMSKISPKPGSISTIIRSFKSVVSKNAHKINPNFEWQQRFHDLIIRNARSFENIQKYIADNPNNWAKDELYT